MKIIFIGAVEIGHIVLDAIYKTNKIVECIFTLPLDAKIHTSGYVDFSSIAKKNQTKLIRTKNLNTPSIIKDIRSIAPDLIIVCGWQRLVCKEIIDIPKLGAIGFHSSLLPKYRGRAPVNWAIIMGEKETGISMFYLTPNADDGDIIAQKRFSILFNDTCKTVYQKAAHAGAELITEYLPKIKNEEAPRIHNPSASYPAYPKRTPEDGLIDFNRSSLEVYNFVRAITKPYPGAFFYDENGNKVTVWKLEIVFDESSLCANDFVLNTLDFKVRLTDWERVK